MPIQPKQYAVGLLTEGIPYDPGPPVVNPRFPKMALENPLGSGVTGEVSKIIVNNGGGDSTYAHAISFEPLTGGYITHDVVMQSGHEVVSDGGTSKLVVRHGTAASFTPQEASMFYLEIGLGGVVTIDLPPGMLVKPGWALLVCGGGPSESLGVSFVWKES